MKSPNRQAVILAGGKGTRLKPYTITFPKPLVPIGDYPILEVIVRQLKRFGFGDIVISTGHLAELIEAYFGNGKRWGVNIRYVREETPLDTAGALKLVDGLQSEFLVMNGDILTTLDYGEFFELHQSKKCAASIATKVRESKVDFGVVYAGKDGFLDRYSEKPSTTFSVSMGIYAMSREVIDTISPGEAIGMPSLLLRLKEMGKQVYCHNSNCYWLDIGRVDDYETAQAEFNLLKSKFLDAT